MAQGHGHAPALEQGRRARHTTPSACAHFPASRCPLSAFLLSFPLKAVLNIHFIPTVTM